MTELEAAQIAVTALTERVHGALKPGMDKNLQNELGKLLCLFPRLARSTDTVLPKLANIAITALLSETPNLALGKQLRKRLETQLRLELNPIRSAIRGKSSAVRVVLGLGVLMYFVIPLLTLSSTFLKGYKTLFGIDIEILALVAFSGALGSIVSIMVRLHDFARIPDDDQAIHFFMGLFKPIVGTAFALFIFAVLSSGIIPVTIQNDKALYFFAALSFIAGFSERFAQDVVIKAESSISSNNKDAKQAFPVDASSSASLLQLRN